MIVQFARWGNSLAIRVPSGFARQLGATEGSNCDMMLEDGKLVISPVLDRETELARLVDAITDENRHAEVEWGPAVGAELG